MDVVPALLISSTLRGKINQMYEKSLFHVFALEFCRPSRLQCYLPSFALWHLHGLVL